VDEDIDGCKFLFVVFSSAVHLLRSRDFIGSSKTPPRFSFVGWVIVLVSSVLVVNTGLGWGWSKLTMCT
jgi:hypothetical protein